MEAQEAKLYRDGEYIKSLCLIGNEDDFDEITVGDDGKMVVTTFETVKKGKGDNVEFVDEMFTYEGITRISFK